MDSSRPALQKITQIQRAPICERAPRPSFRCDRLQPQYERGRSLGRFHKTLTKLVRAVFLPCTSNHYADTCVDRGRRSKSGIRIARAEKSDRVKTYLAGKEESRYPRTNEVGQGLSTCSSGLGCRVHFPWKNLYLSVSKGSIRF